MFELIAPVIAVFSIGIFFAHAVEAWVNPA
jgi:hypothetical protein